MKNSQLRWLKKPGMASVAKRDHPSGRDGLSDTVEERLLSLERRLIEKDAEIRGLVDACSMLLTSTAMLGDDMNALCQISAEAQSSIEKSRTGGTERISPEFFAARGEVLIEVLLASASSDLAYSYWRRSLFPWLDRRRQKKVERFIEAAVQAINKAER